MNKLLKKYLFVTYSETFFPLFLTLYTITSIIFCVKIAALTCVIQINFLELLELYSYSVPTILFYTLPIAIFISLALTLAKLSSEYELIVITSFGLNPMKIIKLILPSLLLSTFLTLVISLKIFCYSYYMKKTFLKDKKTEASFNIKASEYGQEFGRWLIYVDEEKNGLYKDIVLFQQNKDEDTFIIAKYATMDNLKTSLTLSLQEGKVLKIKDGIISYGFAPDIHEEIMKPTLFVFLNMLVIKQLKSKYSIILYELAEDYKSEINLKVKIPKMELSKFRQLMGIKENQYKDFRDLRINCIERAISEINEKTDLTISYEVTKRGRKVTHIDFTTIRKNKLLLSDKEEIEKNKITLAQFVFNVKKIYRGKPFLKPGYLELGKNCNYYKDVIFSIDEDTQLVVNNFDNNKIIDKDLAIKIFKALYQKQDLVGKVKIYPKDFFGETFLLPQRVTEKNELLINGEEQFTIKNITKNDNNLYLINLKNLTENKDVSSIKEFKDEEAIIQEFKILLKRRN